MDVGGDSMLHSRHAHLPASTRHAFALAFDLAARRDAIHSLVVPLLLRAPWILALALLPAPEDTAHPGRVLLVRSAAMLGDFFMLVLVTAMLRFRARSVFNTPAAMHPAPVLECYARGLGRAPWLIVTEVVRNLALVFASFFLFVPAVFLGFRLAFATEAVVLHEPHLSGAFGRSWRLAHGRFERWFEMIVVSVFLVLAELFVVTVIAFFLGVREFFTWYALCQLAVAAVTPLIQYAWTFFYLRLVEAESPGVEARPAYAEAVPAAADDPGACVAGGTGPQLLLVETRREPDPSAEPNPGV
jgi:hypothetical protein